jgi:transposase
VKLIVSCAVVADFGDGYKHGHVRHKNKEYVGVMSDGTKHHTNSVESLWRLFKASVRSTHIHVSSKYMDRYLKEFTFRSNRRGMQNAMFDLLIGPI